MSTQETAPHNWTNGGTEVLILRRCGQDRKSQNNFIYPSGVGCIVEAPDFNSEKKCGGGLHGWPWGSGLGEGADYDIINDVWLVLGALPEDVIGELEGGAKCKCKKATIRFDGNFKGAMKFVRSGFTNCIKEMSKSTGDYSTHSSTGDASKHSSTGDSSKHSSTGDYSKHSSTGDSSTHSSTGDYSKHSSTGDSSKHEAEGDASIIASCGLGSRAKVAKGGVFALAYKTAQEGVNFAVGKEGVNVKADVWYEVKNGNLVEVAK